MKYQTLKDYKMYTVPYCSNVSEDLLTFELQLKNWINPVYEGLIKQKVSFQRFCFSS